MPVQNRRRDTSQHSPFLNDHHIAMLHHHINLTQPIRHPHQLTYSIQG